MALARPGIRRYSRDIYYASVGLLLHCDGSNGGTTFTDNGPAALTVTNVGSCTTVNGGKFNQYLDAQSAGKRLTLGNPAGLQLGSGDFTIEFWYNSQANNDGDVGVGV